MELSADKACMAKQLQLLGYSTLAFDILARGIFGMLRPTTEALLRGWLAGGCVAGI